MENYSFSLDDFQSDFKKDNLGKGKHGYVYKAFCNKYSRYFALKIIEKSEKKEEQLKQLKEYEIMKKVSNPNLEKIYGIFEAKFEGKDCYFFVLEFIDGINLFKLMFKYQNEGKYIDQNLIMKIFYGVESGLYYLHKNGITHRDISPDNIMIDKNNKIIITDFGLSAYYIRYNNVPAYLNYNNSLVGKLLFVGSEIIKRMESGDINILYDEKNDIFALGVTMYHLMTYGYPPCIKKRIKDFNKYKIVDKINEKIYTKNFNKLIMSMLEDDQKKRPRCSDIFQEFIKIRNTNSTFNSVIYCLASFDQLINYLLINDVNQKNENLKKKQYKFNTSFMEALREGKEMLEEGKESLKVGKEFKDIDIKSEKINEFINLFYEKILIYDIGGAITPMNIIKSIFDYFIKISPFIYNNGKGVDFIKKAKESDYMKNNFVSNKIQEFAYCYNNYFVHNFYFLVLRRFKCKQCGIEIGQDLEIKYSLDLINCNNNNKTEKISQLIKHYLENQSSLNLGCNAGGYSLTCPKCTTMPKLLDVHKEIILKPEIFILNLLSEAKLEQYLYIDNNKEENRIYELKGIIAYNDDIKKQAFECGIKYENDWMYFNNEELKLVSFDEIAKVKGVNIAFYCFNDNEYSIFLKKSINNY